MTPVFFELFAEVPRQNAIFFSNAIHYEGCGQKQDWSRESAVEHKRDASRQQKQA